MSEQDKGRKGQSQKGHKKCPSREELLAFIKSCPVPPKKRDITTAFHIRGQDARDELKVLLASFKQEGLYRPHKGAAKAPQGLFQVAHLHTDGRVRAHLIKLSGPPPYGKKLPLEFEVTPSSLFPNLSYLDVGDNFFGEIMGRDKVAPVRLIRDTPQEENLMGVIIQKNDHSYWFLPCDRHHKGLYAVPQEPALGAMVNRYVSARLEPHQPDRVHIIKELGGIEAVTDLTIARYNLPAVFPPAVLAETETMKTPPLGKRRDLREIALVTIDGVHSRDFDDAVWASPDPDPKNPGGWHIIVAIADVSYYVHLGDLVDLEAYKRGNSVYFPDKVVPMLPERLSNDLCSLRPNEERACLAVDLWINDQGDLLRYEFFKGLMRSAARLTYGEVERVLDGETNVFAPRVEQAVENLKGAFKSLLHARSQRGPLSIHIPELAIEFDRHGVMEGIRNAPSLNSHQLIEEFMVLANRAAARFMDKNKLPGIYRVHAPPSAEKLEEFKDFLKSLNLKAKGTFQNPDDFTKLLDKVSDPFEKNLLSEMVLRAQSKAVYEPTNAGHFGLDLSDYAHFTSPIRRYADLAVHRAISACLEGRPLHKTTPESLAQSAAHISERERYAVSAEREAADRFAAFYFLSKVGQEMEGYISGIGKVGLFITFDHVQITGLLPMEAMGDDYYIEKQRPHRLEGRRLGKTFKLGDRMKVVIGAVDLAKGRIRLERPASETGGIRRARPFRKPFRKR